MSFSKQNKIIGGKTGNAIRKLCADQPTKNECVDLSAETVGAYWDVEIGNK